LFLSGRMAAVVAALIASTDTFLFVSSRSVRPEALSALLALLAVFLYMKSRQRNSALLAFAAGISLGLALNFHITVAGIVISLVLLTVIEHRHRAWKRPEMWAMAAGITITILPFLVWVLTDSTRVAAAHAMYLARGSSETMLQKIAEEKLRYRDLLGFGNLKFHLPLPLPFRIHIVMAFLAALFLLLRQRIQLAMLILVLLLPTLLWWIYLVNKTSRYFALAAPFFALTIGMAATIFSRSSVRRRAAVGICLLIIFTQFIGNFIFLKQARTADYLEVASGLRQLIPPQASVYGSITFWEVLRDRRYLSYERTSVPYAEEAAHVSYFIMNDRSMLLGSGLGADDYKGVREAASEVVRRNGTLVGEVPSAFYGELKIYQISYTEQSGPRQNSRPN